MNSLTVIIGDQSVTLTRDAPEYHGVVDLDGERHLIHCTITRAGPLAVSPAKARIRRYVNGIEQQENLT
jgi:hypothetical protein